ncbi:MAG TPA: CARDB domain-containing protein, partial [Haliangiales bacterium]|nr:CARDB domain-containing protein [Haliangiales bacterium]
SASFGVTAVDNNLVDGAEPVLIAATAPGFNTVVETLTATDDDAPRLLLQAAGTSVAETDGNAATMGFITRNTDTNNPLVVTLFSDSTNKLTVPPSVTIPAGQRSVSFNINAVNNNVIEGTRPVRIAASAPGYDTVSLSINVVDDDPPALALSIADALISEGSPSPATIATVTRTPVTARALAVSIGSSNPGAVELPSGVSIPANQASATFNINTRDDLLVNGTRTVIISARTISDLGAVLDAGAATASIGVLDNDGPTLSLQFATDVVAEGGSATGTVFRNTDTSTNLTVALASALTTEATVPAAVVIPAGQASANFAVSGVTDGVSDGIKPVAITASASGFNSASATINVSDIDVPDLQVPGVSAPASGLTDGRVTANWTVANKGLAPVTGSWVDRVYVSADDQVGGDTFLGTVSFSGSLAVGEIYSRAQQFLLPSAPGKYWIIVVTDADGAVPEGSERNNAGVSIAPIDVQPSYRATVQTDITNAPAGTSIPLHGHVFNTADGTAARFKLASVRINVMGIRRVLNVIADGNGDFQTVFQPLPTEAGFYTIGADHPLVTEDTVQDQFTLLGMRANPDQLNLRVAPNTPVSGQIELRNLGEVPLTGLTVQAQGAPAGLNAQLSVTNTLPGSDTVQLSYTFSANVSSQAQFQFKLHLTSAEGVILDLPVNITVVPLQPQLVADPSFLARGMLRGTQTILAFDVSNVGGAPSGDLNVLLPNVPWLSLLSAATVPSLRPGEKTTVTLALNPASDLPLIRYDGVLALAGNQTGLSVPFQFRAVSDAVGDLSVSVLDEYTYFVEGSPKVTNAIVKVKDAITGNEVAGGTTDSTGQVVLTNIREGQYNLEVSATKHAFYRGPVTIVPGMVNHADAFIARQTVTYQWSVVPAEIQDTYRIVLESVFETEVPIPNVTVEDPFVMPLVVEGRATQFEIKLTNHGLIAANGVRITVPDDPSFIITPLIKEIDVLPAKSSMSIPVTIQTRNGSTAGALARSRAGRVAKQDDGGCGVEVHPCLPKIPMGVTYYYVCGPNNVLQVRQIDLSPVCVAKDVYDCIKGLQGAGAAIAESEGNLAKASCEIIDAILTCAGAELSECQKAALQIACRTIVGAATGGAAGAAAGAGSGLADSLGCLCSLISQYASLPSGTPPPPSGGSGFSGWTASFAAYASGFGGIGGGGGGGACNSSPFSTQRVIGKEGGRPIGKQQGDAGVCARVRIRIEQEAVMTRAAFLGTLEIDNGGNNTLTGIRLTLDFRDETGGSAGERFAIRGPELSGLSAVDGTGSIGAGASGSAQYTFIPTRDAAPASPTIYRIGGTLRYIEDGQEVVVPLLSSTITVFPEARLQ